MKTELEKFNQVVDILVKAYFNNTLNRMYCDAFAVGNIMKGFGIARPSGWTNLNRAFSSFGMECIRVTGYTPEEIDKIEKAFMRWGRLDLSPETQRDVFCSLLRCVDALAEIHNIDLTVKENAKLLFVKA